MDCKKINKLIHDFVDGSLERGTHAEAKRHIDECSKCAQELDELRSLNALLSDMPPETVPVGFADRVVAKLKVAGRIAEPVSAPVGVFHWTRRRFRVSLAGVALLLVAVVVFPLTIGSLEGIAGKGTVLVADTYLAVQEAVANADFLFRIVDSLEDNFGTLKTIALAGLSLLVRAGELFMIPAALTILLLTLGALFFFRVTQKRSAEHATFSF